MIYLALSILTSCSIFLIFKLFEKYKVDNFQAIVVNYFVAIVLGIVIAPEHFDFNIINKPWSLNAFIVGSSFIVLFVLMAVTSQKVGISVTSVANKMSVVIPVMFAGFLYGDTYNAIKIIGIVLALLGVYLVTKKDNKQLIDKKLLLFPFIIFILNGLLDTYIKYTQETLINGDATFAFVPTVFSFSLITGLIIVIIKFKSLKFEWKNVLWGVVLGIPNYGSIYFLMKTLEIKGIQSSAIFPINNMGIVAVSSIAAYILFKEVFSKTNWVGIVISIIAITLIAFS